MSKENIIKQCSLYLGKHTTANVHMEGGAHCATIPQLLLALNLNAFKMRIPSLVSFFKNARWKLRKL